MSGNIKGEIKSYYGGIAKKVKEQSRSSCSCKMSCCKDDVKLYTKEFIDGLPEEAISASLGCANPKKGEIILDL